MKETMMYLNDNLQICLLAVEGRYPKHTIDLDYEVMTMPDVDLTGWTAQELIRFLDATAPHLLQTPAHLNIDECNCEIYLPTLSEKQPAFHIHCRGKIPDQRHLESKADKATH
jgi:hypothetical protein